MKYLNGQYYIEVKGQRYKNHPTENIILQKRDPPQSLRTQYQVQNETQIRTNQKVIRDDNNELGVENYPKNKQPIIQQPEYKPPYCPSFKKNWLEFDKRYYCKNCEYIINKQKHQIGRKVLRQDHYFSTGLPYANKKIREIYYSMVITTYNSTEDMINKLQSFKNRKKIKFYKNSCKYYDNMNIRMDEDPSARKAQGFSKFFNEILLLMKILQTKPQVKNRNFNFYDLHYTVDRNRGEKEVVDNQFVNDSNNFNDFITSNHYIGNEKNNKILK